MMLGVVNDRLEATLWLPIEDATGHPQRILVTIDTGFNCELVLPGYLISRLGLRWVEDRIVRLANGDLVLSDIYEALVDWDGTIRQVRVHQVETDPLIGTELLDGYEVKIQFRDGGSVVIEEMP